MTALATSASRRGRVFLCGLIPVVLTALLAIYRPGVFPRLDDTVYDTVMRSGGTARPGNKVLIVDIDERSLTALGQWPWRRDVIGQLIARLRDMGASVVAMDIIFAEADRLEIKEGESTRRASPDDLLADVLRQGRVVLGYGLTFESGPHEKTPCVLHPVSLAVVHPSDETGDTPYFHATGAVCSLPILAQAAGASGFLNAAPDPDGILRRVPVVAELEGRL